MKSKETLMKTMKRGAVLACLILMILFLIFSTHAVPQGPDTINISTSGRNPANTQPITVQAKAGNVTGIVIDGTRVTEAWQGYYGNITGRIVLDDGFNYTLYDWNLPQPTGEIYASNGSSVDWTKIYCMNLSYKRPLNGSLADDVDYRINMTQIELNFGINLSDSDGLNETFFNYYTNAVGFRVGAITINNEDGCSMAHPYTDEVYNTAWQELLLTDNESLIFTALIRDNADSYKPSTSSETADFQMLVLENGHWGSADTTTPYYFYVELS